MPAGRPSSLLTGQNRLPGFGAEVASTGSVEASVVSTLVSQVKQGGVGAQANVPNAFCEPRGLNCGCENELGSPSKTEYVRLRLIGPASIGGENSW